MTVWYVLAALVLFALWFGYAFLAGRPWTVRQLFSRTFLKFVLKGPELLTYLGILERLGYHRHNAKLSDASEEFATKTFRFMKRDLEFLRGYSRRGKSAELLVSMDVMEWFLDDLARDEIWRYHDYPVNQMFGVQSSTPDFMLTMHPLDSVADIKNYPRRLAAISRKFDQVLDGLRLREQKGCVPPAFVIQRVLDEMKAFIAKPAAENPLYTVFRDKIDGGKKLPAARRDKILAEVDWCIAESVYPAYRRLIAYFDGLAEKVKDDHGVWALPEGDAYYANCLRSNTTTEYSPEQVHQIGLAEVARIETQMREILVAQGQGDTENPAGVLADLGKDDRFLYPDTDEGRTACVADYQKYLDEMNAGLDPWFSRRPKAQLKVERIPEFKEKTAPGAYYQPADVGGARPGIFYANLRDMKEVHKFGMKTLAYHEGIPGHHFQIALAQEQQGLPFFRRHLPFTAYAEGWAMYSEELAREMGAYKDDPYGLLGSLDSELFRAVRLVVDTGIHYKRWTRQQAIDYMSAHSAQALESIVSEVERYFVMPGQACAYKIGMIKLLQLRQRAEKALGDTFDIRRFHDVVLGLGSVPLSILEAQVDSWIAAGG